jgi:glutamate formiminotransferase / 5-formyltetrahydrofolate cyclo-ligase
MELPLLESVPNVGAGRDARIVDVLVEAVREGISRGARVDGSGAVLADVHRDVDHDRSVFTIVGRGEALAMALLELARGAVAHIDVHAGHGVHPRVGVLDVIPVVALDEYPGAAAAAHELVRRMAGGLGRQLEVPVVRYGLDERGDRIPGAATTGEVRRGGPASVAERVVAGELQLLGGPTAPHPSAGITICGVRDVLIAFNVDLAVDDIDSARAIAARIRETAAGSQDALPGVRALGLRLPSRGLAQVSTNVERYRECGPARVLETIVRIATELSITVERAELVGLAPASSLAALRYASTTLGLPLAAATAASIEDAVALLAD